MQPIQSDDHWLPMRRKLEHQRCTSFKLSKKLRFGCSLFYEHDPIKSQTRVLGEDLGVPQVIVDLVSLSLKKGFGFESEGGGYSSNQESWRKSNKATSFIAKT